MTFSPFLFGGLLVCILAEHSTLSNRYPSSQKLGTTGDKCTVVNGKKLFYNVQGAGRSRVVFVSALGEDHNTWKEVQGKISQWASTVSYDRSGLGFSEYNETATKDAFTMAKELHQLILTQKIKTPFIIVSHSLGCDIAKVYMATYPNEISGAVYIDPPPDPEQLKKEAGNALWEERERAIKQYTPEMNKAQQQEYDLQNTSFRQADAATKLPVVPAILLTATLTYPDFPASALELKVKKETHARWLSQMKGAKQVFVSSSRHYIQNDTPQVVINAIKEIIERQ